MIGPIPVGALAFAVLVLLAVHPLRSPPPLARASWILSVGPNELPFALAAIVLVSNVPPLVADGVTSADDRALLALSTLTLAGLVVIAVRASTAGPVLARALDEALGTGWRKEVEPPRREQFRRHLPWARILLAPWPVRPRSVEARRGVAYGEQAHRRLDVYRHRSHPTGAPCFVYFHGGGFTRGRKSFEARALLHRLAAQGWTCISADYHLARTPAEGFPHHLVDAKRAVAWAREHHDELGIDPDAIVGGGSSAGAHLTAMLALTAGDPRFQPGFEGADCSIRAGIGLYGYYGALAPWLLESEPAAHAGADSSPLLVVHGDHDTYTPVEGAREFVEATRARSGQPVAYAELPGAQHSFDVFHSLRFEQVVDAAEAFASWAIAPPRSVRR